MSTEPLPEGSWPALHDVSRWIGTWVFHLIFRLHLHGRSRVPATGPVVLVANHSAFIDGPLLFGQLRRRTVFLVKHEAYRGPLGWYLRRIGQLPVRRGEAERAPLLAAVRILHDGGVVAVFPEGTRGEGDVASAQHGAAWLARSAGAVVLPVVCRGTRWPGGGSGRRRFRPRVDVLVGEPFSVSDGRGRAALAAGTERIRGELAGLVAQLDQIRPHRRHSTPTTPTGVSALSDTRIGSSGTSAGTASGPPRGAATGAPRGAATGPPRGAAPGSWSAAAAAAGAGAADGTISGASGGTSEQPGDPQARRHGE